MNLEEYLKLTGFDTPEEKGMNIAILDSGFNTDNDNVKYRFNATNKTDDVTDNRGHGTAIYEIINRISPNSNYYLFKTLDDNGQGDMLALYEALIRVRDNDDIDIVSMSFSSFQPLSPTTLTALKECLAKGKILVSALGNDSRQVVTYPSGIEGVYKVGALSDTDINTRYEKSNYSNKTDFVALGQNIMANGELRSGTSFATAIVVGQIAELMASKDISREDFNYQLMRTYLSEEVRTMDTANGHIQKSFQSELSDLEQKKQSKFTESDYQYLIAMYSNGYSLKAFERYLIPYNMKAKDFFDRIKQKEENGGDGRKRLSETLKKIIASRDKHGIRRTIIAKELNLNFITVRRACEKYGKANKHSERTNDLDLYEKLDKPIHRVDGGIACVKCGKRANSVDESPNVFYCGECFEEYTIRFRYGENILYRTRWENVG